VRTNASVYYSIKIGNIDRQNSDLKDSKFEAFCRDLWRARIVWEIRTGRRDKEGKKTPVVYEGDEEGV
jgi:hypothetical protein